MCGGVGVGSPGCCWGGGLGAVFLEVVCGGDFCVCGGFDGVVC